jgi:phosphoenolpyruvate synthase/pyruvate phosphate dikinase
MYLHVTSSHPNSVKTAIPYGLVTSSHPNSVKTAIPYGLGIRAKRICSEDEDYSVRRTEIKTQVRKRGYTNDMVEKQLKKWTILIEKTYYNIILKNKIIVFRW